MQFIRADGLIPVFRAFRRRANLPKLSDADFSLKYPDQWRIIKQVTDLMSRMETGELQEDERHPLHRYFDVRVE